MSIFASQTQATIPMQGDADQTITIRRLTGLEYEAVCEAHRGSVAAGRANAWPTLFRRALTPGTPDTAVLAALADPLTGHDRFMLVKAGLVAWSYPQSVKPVKAKAAVAAKGTVAAQPAVEASDAIADLDDESVDFIATEVLRLTKPALFVAAEAVEDTQKELPAAAPAA